ncbi:hypothetical protein BCR33DRAFT_793031 [Rhizoclosmatium globosum]|uniref:Uncharacterized protein n=1 Tax=Rhizoclosmatium globosum TaxID=329046 RepID=A0A1Y2B3Q5_9FUNG|nr:hypothetical protein HDU99_004739 [Rhizoclosmatium hyalinum]KAJ3298791.1 hypothetical protein HDU79_006834 [Rhizoclosmatium sp. JEL0117]ORY29462.1 hypothetical protein BCR33DRAFT_793031 [Rhizoclosmatium globosum]|eukprot:ORY29462.1 hypothetical protein BCR33DRAFT_793031 [Rhizoclosmatium globosum]
MTAPSEPATPFPIAKLSAFFAGGLFLNSFARSMARLPLKGNPLSYLAYATATTAFGYGIHKFQIAREQQLEVEKDKLTKRRMLAAAAAE